MKKGLHYNTLKQSSRVLDPEPCKTIGSSPISTQITKDK